MYIFSILYIREKENTMKSWIEHLAENYHNLHEEEKSLEAVVKKHIDTFNVSAKDLATHADKIAAAIKEEHFPKMDIEKIKAELQKYAKESA
jgi:hypothetical protein